MRRSFPLALATLVAGLALLVGCKKKPQDIGDPPPNTNPPGVPGAPNPPTPGGTVASEYPLFLHFNAKQVRDSSVFAELKTAVVKTGGTALWDEIDGSTVRDFGVKLTEVESVSVFVTDVPAKREPDTVVILSANKAFDKSKNRLARTDDFIFKKGDAPRKWPDARGFYRSGGAGELAHYADDKTLVLLSEGLADKYLAGFAKGRTGWPFTAELSKAASAHGLYVSANLDKLPSDAKADFGEFRDLLSAKALTLTANLRGKELSASARATYPSPAAAAAAQKQLQGLIGEAKGAMKNIDRELGRELRPIAGALKPVFAEAERVVGGAQPAVSGSDLTLSASYKADFDIAALVADAVKQLKEKAPLDNALNNYKQVGLGLHNFESATLALPVHAIGANGVPVKGPNDKALLSWRVAILPYIEQDNLYRQFKLDEPWDSENNKKLIPMMPKIYAPATKPPAKEGYTHMQMLIGPGGTPLGTKLVGILDGTSNTLAVVEAAEPVIWTKPDDLVVPFKYNAGELRKKFGGEFPNMFPVLFWDGSTRFMSGNVSEKTLSLLCFPSDGQVIPQDAFERPPPPPGVTK
jgi:Protein of unknown function (DUF1559)